MKKLKKLKLNDLRNEVLLISDDEMCRLVGGGSEYDGGWLPEVVCYGIYTYDGGWFDDVYSYGNSGYTNFWYFYFNNNGTALTNYYDYGGYSYHGVGGSSDLGGGGGGNSYYPILGGLINQLPQHVRMDLSHVRISYDPTLSKEGRYYENTCEIKIKTLDYSTLYGEVIHAIQHKYGYCGDNHAAKEFQEHVIGDIELLMSGRGGAMRTIFNNDFPSTFDEWISECFNDDASSLNLNKFLNGVNNYIYDFQKSHDNVKEYQGYIPRDYDFHWIEMFQKLGISTY